MAGSAKLVYIEASLGSGLVRLDTVCRSASMANDPRQWSREFREMGVERVRSSLVVSDWDRQKRAAARLWLEAADTKNWQRQRTGEEAPSRSFIAGLRGASWWRYVAPAAMGLMAVAYILRRFH
jgi:hypothetical protein